MLDGSNGSSSAAAARAAEQARIRAEQERQRELAQERAREAAQQAAEAKEKVENAKLSASSAKFRGAAEKSTFESGKGKTVKSRTSVRADSSGRTTTRQKSTRTPKVQAEYYSKTRTQAPKAETEKSGKAKLAGASVSRSVGNKRLVGGETTLAGGIKASGEVKGPGAALDASANAGVSGGELKVGLDVKVDAHLLAAQGKIEKDVDFSVGEEHFRAKVTIGSDAKIGADGEVHLDVALGLHGAKVDVGASGFAGAEGSLKGEVELDELKGGQEKELLDGSLTGTAVAGAAGSAKFDAGIHGGKFGVHASAEGALGVGAGLSFDGEVDLGNSAVALKDLAFEGLVAPAFHSAERDAVAVTNTVVGGAKSAANTVATGASTVAHGVSSGYSAAKSAVSSALGWAGL